MNIYIHIYIYWYTGRSRRSPQLMKESPQLPSRKRSQCLPSRNRLVLHFAIGFYHALFEICFTMCFYTFGNQHIWKLICPKVVCKLFNKFIYKVLYTCTNFENTNRMLMKIQRQLTVQHIWTNQGTGISRGGRADCRKKLRIILSISFCTYTLFNILHDFAFFLRSFSVIFFILPKYLCSPFFTVEIQI